MIKIENVDVVGWEPAIRGMRNPMNSWENSDSVIQHGDQYWGIENNNTSEFEDFVAEEIAKGHLYDKVFIGPKDHDLMMRLCKAGSADAKFRRFIICYADITAPLYMLKEMDTYRMGVEKNSCSTMHKIHAKPFTPDDFSHEHLLTRADLIDPEYRFDPEKDIALSAINVDGNRCYFTPEGYLEHACQILNRYREKFLETKDKRYWWQMIQLLPSSYNQRRTYMFSYEVLSKIYRERRNHKLDEWHQFCDWVESLPYSEIITLKEEKG